MFRKVLIANRGAIACRIIRTLKALGVQSVAVYSEADAQARHVREADEAYLLGPAPAAESYLKADRILQIARDCGAEAIHPGYGFLSENPGFAQACEDAGIAFIGPTPEQMRAFGLKHTARDLAEQRGVPLLPGTGLLADAAQARAEALRIGYPVMLKSTAGGGGIGMRLVWSAKTSSATRLPRCSAWPVPTSRTPASSWKSTSSRRATSRCRCSATARARCSRWAGATARCSAATRR